MSWNAALTEISNQLTQYDITQVVSQETAKAILSDLSKIAGKLIEIFKEFGKKEINPAMMLQTQLILNRITELSAHYSKLAEPAMHAALKATEEMMKLQV